MFQRDNARPHVARICTQFLEAENVPVLPWPAYLPDMSPTERTTACSNQQHDQLYAKEMSHCMKQMVVTPDPDWFSDPHPYFFVYLYSHYMKFID
jgi:hypothetical protein